MTWICERCPAKFKLLCSCAKCLGRNWHGYASEQMSGRINWLGKVFQAPVQSILVGDIREDCAEPHLQQWQTFRNRMGWFSGQCGLRLWDRVVTQNFVIDKTLQSDDKRKIIVFLGRNGLLLQSALVAGQLILNKKYLIWWQLVIFTLQFLNGWKKETIL